MALILMLTLVGCGHKHAYQEKVVEAKPAVQSLKVEQDSKKAYTYGNLEKEFSKSDSKENENFANVLDEADKHEPSILKIFNSLTFY